MNTTKTIEKKMASITLSAGCHSTEAVGLCAMEAVAYIAGEAHSDHPECACPVITAFVLHWNDMLISNVFRDYWIKPLVPLLVDSRPKDTSSDHYVDVLKKRALLCMNFACHTCVPLALNTLKDELVQNGFSNEASTITTHMQTLKNLGCVTPENMEAMNIALGDAISYITKTFCGAEERTPTITDAVRSLSQAKESTRHFTDRIFKDTKGHIARHIEFTAINIASLSFASLNYAVGDNTKESSEGEINNVCVSLVHRMLAVK